MAKSQIDTWTFWHSQGEFGPLGFAAKARFGWLSPIFHRFLRNPAASSARPEIKGVTWAAVTLLPHLMTTQPLGWGDRSGWSAA